MSEKSLKEDMDEIRKKVLRIFKDHRLTNNQNLAFGDITRILTKIENGDIF